MPDAVQVPMIKNPWKDILGIPPLYAGSIFVYFMCFEFSRKVLLGDYTTTGPVANILIYSVLTMSAGFMLLVFCRQGTVAGLLFSIVAPFLFPTVFVQMLILIYEVTGKPHFMMDEKGDALRWLVDAPKIVMQLWYVFVLPSMVWWALVAGWMRWKSTVCMKPTTGAT